MLGKPESERFGVNPRIQLIKVCIGWSHGLVKDQDILDNSCNPPGTFKIPKVALHSTNVDRIVDRPRGSKRIPDDTCLYWVDVCCPRPTSLNSLVLLIASTTFS